MELEKLNWPTTLKKNSGNLSIAAANGGFL